MTENPDTIFIVDDDEAIRNGLSMLLQSYGYRAEPFESATDFLARCAEAMPERYMAILDLSMPDMTGLELQAELLRRHIDIPVVFLSGEGGIPAAVDAVRQGAVDFIEKPVASELLFDRIEAALKQQCLVREDRAEAGAVQSRLQTLTPREREVLENIAGGKTNKMIAYELGISERTVELHRSRVLHKMRVRNSSELFNRVVPNLRPAEKPGS